MSGIRKGTLAPIIIGVLGVSILLGLGAWQVQRLGEKEAVIAEIETRMASAPVALPSSIDPVRDSYLRVALTGRLGPDELNVLTSIKRVGPGFLVIAPMELDDGRRVLVDLGFVPERLKNIEDRAGSVRLTQRGLTDRVVGILRSPQEVDSFTPDPDLGRGIWFARDVPRMAEALGTAPIMVIAEEHPMGDMPLPRPPGVDLPNRHLEYALTWFGLAIVWTAMSIVWLRRELRLAAQ